MRGKIPSGMVPWDSPGMLPFPGAPHSPRAQKGREKKWILVTGTDHICFLEERWVGQDGASCSLWLGPILQHPVRSDVYQAGQVREGRSPGSTEAAGHREVCSVLPHPDFLIFLINLKARFIVCNELGAHKKILKPVTLLRFCWEE